MSERTIISRDGWEARPPKRPFTKLKPSRVQGVVLHHSGVKDGPKGMSALKAYERFHMDSRGWNAIAYNWLVDEAGVIYAGRGAGVVSGATKGWNSRTESICFTGWGEIEAPQAALDSIKWLINDINSRKAHNNIHNINDNIRRIRIHHHKRNIKFYYIRFICKKICLL